MSFMMQLGSRRQLRFERLAARFEQNLAKLCGRQRDLETVADPLGPLGQVRAASKTTGSK